MPHRTGKAINFNGVLHRFVRAALTAVLLCGADVMASSEASWPETTIPKGVETFNAGEQMNVNGVPLRMRGLLSLLPPVQVAALFRASMGAPLVESSHGSTLVLGRPLGEFYVTVQLEQAGAGTRGVLAVTRLSTPLNERAAIGEVRQHSLSRFPTGSRLVSRTSSVDGKQRDEFLVLTNAHGVELNIEHIKHTLGNEGYTLVRETSPNSANLRSGTTLLFQRTDSEITAVVFRDAGGNTAVAFNTVASAEVRP